MIHKTHLRWLRQSAWKPVLQFPGSGFQVWEHPEHGMERIPLDVELGLDGVSSWLLAVEFHIALDRSAPAPSDLRLDPPDK